MSITAHDSRPSVGRPALVLLLLGVAVAGFLAWRYLAPDPGQPHLDAGLEAAGNGDFVRAEREWRQATTTDPNNLQAWMLLAKAYLSSRRWGEARLAYENVRRIDPSAGQIGSTLAACALHLGDYAAAERYAAEELKKDPDNVSALETAAAVQSRVGDTAARIGYLRRLAELQPGNLEYQRALAWAVYSAGDFATLRTAADRIVQRDPRDTDAWALLGQARFATDPSKRGMAQAESDLLHGLALRPDHFLSHLVLGRIYSRRNALDKALTSFRQAARLQPASGEAWYALADVYKRKGNKEMAAQARERFRRVEAETDRFVHLKRLCDATPGDFGLNLTVGLLAGRRGDSAAARYYLDRAHALRPDDPRATSAGRGHVSQNGIGGP